MNSSHGVVGAWAAGNVVLALGLLAFSPAPLPFFLYIAGSAIVAAFGVAVLWAVQTGRVGTQQRQPRRASAAVFTVLGVVLGLTGLTYGWWLSVLAFYPLVLAAWLVRGERLPRGARPWPVALDGAEPATPPGFVHHDSSIGAAVPIPVEHAAHGPPPAAPSSDRLGRAILLVLLVAAVRAIVEVLRGRRR
jgi:hypothetical protein